MCKKGNHESEGSGNDVGKEEVDRLEYLAWREERLRGAWGGCSQVLGKPSSGRDWVHPVNPGRLVQIRFDKEKSVYVVSGGKMSMGLCVGGGSPLSLEAFKQGLHLHVSGGVRRARGCETGLGEVSSEALLTLCRV